MNLNKIRRLKYVNRKNALILLVIGSLLSIFLTPLSRVKQEVTSNLPWVAAGTILTETMFIVGLGIMAWEAEEELGRNPLLWRKRIHKVINHLVTTKAFWVGFWVNAAGALGTAIIVGLSVILTFPVQSWGLLWVPALDLAATITIRASAIGAIGAIK